MALSGSFTGTTNNDYVRPKITWSATQSVSGNYSTVKATLSYSRTNTGYTTYGTWSGSLTINGNKATGSKSIEITYNSNTVAITHTVTVNHNADGTKSITISATGGLSGTSTTSTSISATVTLDTIPRATTPTVSSSSVYMGNTVTINTPRASSSFTHDLAYSFAGGSYVSLKTGVGTSYSWATTTMMANDIPNATSGTVTIRCITKNGSTTIGTKTVTMTLKVPTTMVPTISEVTTAEATSGLAAQFGAYIKGKSKIKTTITAAGAGGSTIKSYSTTFNGKTYAGSSWTSPEVDSSGTLSLVTTVKDSRGRTAKKTINIEVLDYSKPVINTFSVYRCNASGTAADDGEYIAIRYKYSAPSLNGGNTAAMTVSYKLTSATNYTTLLTGSAISANTTAYPTTKFSVDSSYNLKITVKDYFGAEVSTTRQLSTAAVILDFGADGKSVGIGKVSELENYLDIKFKTRHRADLDFDNGVRLYAYDSTGNLKQVLAPQTGANHLALGYGNYERAEGNTNLYGHDIQHYVSNIASPGSYRPYRRKGDTFNVTVRTAGYVTNNGKDISFFLPLSMPAIGSPTVTVASIDGFTLRQGTKYTHGSSASTTCKPSSYSVARSMYYGLVITASFTDTTNVTNNDAIGIYWNGSVTFS